jgi:phage protein D
MATSNNIKNGGIATFVVKVGGTAIPNQVQVLSIRIEKRINKISMARIVVLDGEANTRKFDVSSSSTFAPGVEVAIEAGYDTKNKLVFKGIITQQSIRIDNFNGSVLEIECRDAAIKMVVGRRNTTFSKKKDSEIISSIIGSYSGLTSDITATSTTWPKFKFSNSIFYF